MTSPVENVDDYIKNHQEFSDLLISLRNILKEKPLEETIKWGVPTYVYKKKNLLGLGAFKNHVSIWFFQGALLKDKHQLLRNAQEEKTKAMRQIRFESIGEIDSKILGSYTIESIEYQRQGIVIKPTKKTSDIIIPIELKTVFSKTSGLEKSFGQLTAGKQREYIEHIISAKKEVTKLSRIEKIIP